MDPSQGRVKKSSTFRACLPVIGTSFVNKSGAIGLSLLPMLLVQRELSVGESSMVMSVVKSAQLGGTLLSGWACDVFGMKAVILFSFLASVVGLGALPVIKGVVWIALAGLVAQLGNAMFMPPMRLLIVRLVEARDRPEAIAWMRTANNFGQIFSYSLGTLLAGLGMRLLFWFDSITALAALVLGFFWLPAPPKRESVRPEDLDQKMKQRDIVHLFAYTVVLSGFGFLYDLFMAGAAGRFQLHLGNEGLRLFSMIMVLNTLFCAVLAITASRYLRRADHSLLLGLVLAGVGSALALYFEHSRPMIFFGMFILTLGEIIFGALSQFILLEFVPAGKAQGSIYGIAMTVQVVGRIAAGALAFPWVVHAAHPGGVFLFAVIPFALILLWLAPVLKRKSPGLASS